MQKRKNKGQESWVMGQGLRRVPIQRMGGGQGQILKGILFYLLPLAFSLLPIFAIAEEKTKADEPPQPINITSNRMDANKKEQIVIFTGNVVAVQKDMTIDSDELKVYYTEGDDVREIIAIGNVKITQPNRVATGEKAVYTKADSKVVLTGNPQAQQGNDTVKGDRITVFLNDNKSIVESDGTSRVKAVIFPKKGQSK
ncbi:MAG: lipopolysaccharide transport periplasmic protein LptA [Deltaproteobacteria bacterium]|nr:lipopolysaccharide transport periplasmic protein LptA [Deltaproteobacteria bacterium]